MKAWAKLRPRVWGFVKDKLCPWLEDVITHSNKRPRLVKKVKPLLLGVSILVVVVSGFLLR